MSVFGEAVGWVAPWLLILAIYGLRARTRRDPVQRERRREQRALDKAWGRR